MAKEIATPFLGGSKTLNNIGSHAYGFSGSLEPNNSSVIGFDFHTSNKGMILEMGWTAEFTSLTAGRYVSLEVKLNDVVVLKQDGQMTSANDFPVSFPYVFSPMLIPPNTNVIITVSTNEDAVVAQCVTLKGTEI
tara:strand:- start:99 stop:503 length:405 start_codon:yes stop_codon:yes gene_type:complete